MTLLITTDFHASLPALKGLDKLLQQKKYDGVLMLGDLINPNPKELPYVDQFIDLIKKFNLPLFGLHGNNEPVQAYEKYRQAGINIHLETKTLGNYKICGVGGWGNLTEIGFEDLSVNNLNIDENTIFVTHIPPLPSIKTVNSPLIHLFGHKHVLAFTKQVGNTLQIQCPAAIEGRVTELILPAKTVNFINLPKS